MAKKITNWATRFEKMRSRGKFNSIELHIVLSPSISWWEIIEHTEPTKGNCEYWDEVRREFVSAAKKGKVNYSQYFPSGGNSKKVAHLQGDELTIRQWLDLYIEDLQKPRLKPRTTNTIVINKRRVEVLKKKFGNKNLSELSYREVDQWIEKQNITQKTVENKLAPLRWCYAKAKKKRIIPENIFSDGYPDAPAESLHVKDAFTPDEIHKILTVDMPEHVKNMTIFWLYSGLRTGEITALKWSKWDKINNTIIIDEVRRQGKQELGAKTQAGVRKFSLMPQAIEVLKRQEKISKFNPENDEKLIFLNESLPWDYDFAACWRGILKAAKVRYRIPYNLRHTFATMKLSYEGIESIGLLSHDIGHDSIKTTKKSYVDYELININWSEIYRMVI